MSEPLIPGGCILLARKIIDSEIWEKPPLYIKVWVFLLTKAQHSEYKGLKRGQVLTSIPEIIEGVSWKVGARIERPTKDQVFQVLEFLRGKAMKSKQSPDEDDSEATTNALTKATMITTTKATHHILINIDNYAVYQDFRNYESNDESKGESESQSNGGKGAKATREQRQPDNINKNDKNVKNDKNEDNKKPSSRQQKTYAEDSLYFKMARYLHDRIMKYAESISVAHLVRDANLQKWADEFRKLVENKNRDKDEIRMVIEWTTENDFWRGVVLSAAKFREKYDELCFKMAAATRATTPKKTSLKATSSGKPKLRLTIPKQSTPVSKDRLEEIKALGREIENGERQAT